MDPDRHPGLVDQTPEGIEAGISWRDETTRRVGRAALDADDSGISLEDTTKLGTAASTSMRVIIGAAKIRSL